MELPKYTKKALKTAQPEAFSHDYLIPGIVGEIGELFGQRAKAHWHGWSAEKFQEQAVKEYGDICWMTAILLHTLHVDDVAVRPDFTIMDPDTQLLVQGLLLYSDWTDDEPDVTNSAVNLWNLLRTCAEGLTGSSFDHVLKVNLEKLKSRAERGVLRGAGDDR